MSRLWSRWRLRQTRIGLAVGREGVCAASLTTEGQGMRLEWLRHERLALELFCDRPTAQAVAEINAILARIVKDIRKEYAPAGVALPDPVVTQTLFELESCPKTKAAQVELARWRFAQELRTDAETIACDCQDLGVDNGTHLLLGLATDRAWLQTVIQACRQVDIMPARVNRDSCFRFNYFYDDLTGTQQHGAMVCLDERSWSLNIWDGQGRMRFSRARWREAQSGADQEYGAIAAEIERIIRSYARPGSGRAVAKLYLSGLDQDCTRLSTILDAGMQEPCQRLSVQQHLASINGLEPDRVPLAAAAVAAAM